MDTRMTLILIAFLMSGALVACVGLLFGNPRQRIKSRLRELNMPDGSVREPAPPRAVARAVQSTLPKVGKHLMPEDMDEQTRLKARLIHAGFYRPQSIFLFLGIKMLLIVSPTFIGLAAGLIGLIPTNYGVLLGACAGIGGLIGPSFFLDHCKSLRQTAVRRAMPDALDLVVVSMDGGLSLPAALQRVTDELQTVHPILAFELGIVEREIQFGYAIGDALRNFATRSDLDEVRSLAATVKNAEKFGASMTKMLRTYAEVLRSKRQQYAEEMAQKAGTKILFPTLLFIFPAIFLIILGPAAIQLIDVMSRLR